MKLPVQHILLIDDDQDDRYFFATALEEVDPEVKLTVAGDGQEALRKLETTRPDLILVDLVMPGMSGLSFIRNMKSDPRLRDIPVIVYTSDLSVFHESEVRAIGAGQVIIKSSDYPGTVEIISGLLQRTPLRKTA